MFSGQPVSRNGRSQLSPHCPFRHRIPLPSQPPAHFTSQPALQELRFLVLADTEGSLALNQVIRALNVAC